MKKIVIALVAFVLLAALILYFLLPNKIVITQAVFVKASAAAGYRSIADTRNWHKWWPQKEQTNTNRFSIEATEYSLSQKQYNLFLITIKNNADSLSSQFLLVPLSNDSMAIEWRTNPLVNADFTGKIRQYFAAKSLKKNMAVILASLKSFLEKPENLYEAEIKEAKVKDSVLVASRIVTTYYPSVEDIYSTVEKLKIYIQEKGAKETDYPMLHVDSVNGKFLTMVGIPTDTTVGGNGKDIELKRMVLGNILVTEIKGGPNNIKKGMRELELYVDEYERTSPAIPFQSLITDRSKQPDTTKWITKIYYPVY